MKTLVMNQVQPVTFVQTVSMTVHQYSRNKQVRIKTIIGKTRIFTTHKTDNLNFIMSIEGIITQIIIITAISHVTIHSIKLGPKSKHQS